MKGLAVAWSTGGDSVGKLESDVRTFSKEDFKEKNICYIGVDDMYGDFCTTDDAVIIISKEM